MAMQSTTRSCWSLRYAISSRKHFRRESYYVAIVDIFRYDVPDGDGAAYMSNLSVKRSPYGLQIRALVLRCHPRRVHVSQSYPSGTQTIELYTHHCHRRRVLPDPGWSLDSSVTAEQIGRISTDVLGNKDLWSMNTALVACMPEQRRVLNGNHERKNSECERRVLEVFESSEVGLRMTNGMYEEGVYREPVVMIGEIPGVKGKSILKGEVFKRFVARP
ncbi:hypothetical protein IW261DRAFT_726970 [Armillaria novae-zelandiae]|uniref:Uncharacterized protein n=1 Tax=Armillaria novae-zelandiae TaxID=153914 RepID=A0AA39UBR3_9AGAR|nr:hypothetical protein IW261DRAFT_726970 [Armillaria novae-zelandiae]